MDRKGYQKEYRDCPYYKLKRVYWLQKHLEYYRQYYFRNKNKIREKQKYWLKRNKDSRKRYLREYMRSYRKRSDLKL